MKYGHLERLRVALTTSAPVFIGSQNKLNSRECIYIRDKGIVYVPDIPLLIEEIHRHNCMKQYEDFLTSSLTQQGFRQNLYGFLRSMNISINENAPWILYKINVGSEFNQLNGLDLFVRNAQGQPYIPGSSIKGAIRSALLAARISDADLNQMIENMRINPKNRRIGVEEYSLRLLSINNGKGQLIRKSDAITDLLKGLHISDSAPFTNDSTVVCKKLEISSNGELRGDGGRRSAPPVYRECLKLGLITHFYITFDRNVLGHTLSREVLAKALTTWYSLQCQYIDQFNLANYDLKALTDPGIPLILGAGVGFQQHSLIYRMKDPEQIKRIAHAVLKAQFYRTYKPYPNDPVPYRLKLANYLGHYYPMGHCRLVLED